MDSTSVTTVTTWKKSTISENILSVVLAGFFAFGLYTIISTNFTSLQANIAWVWDELSWDVIVTQFDSRVEVTNNKIIEWVQSVTFFVFYDPEEVGLDSSNWQGVGKLSLTEENPWRITVLLEDLPESLSPGENLFEIPVISWDATRVVVSDVNIWFADGSSSPASLSNR